MPEYTDRGIQYPLPGDRIKDGAVTAKLASDIEAVAKTANTAMDDLLGSVQAELGSALKVRRDYTALPANVEDWIGLEWEGIWIIPVATTMFTGLPSNIGVSTGFVASIIPMGSGGSMIRVYEYAGEQRVFSRTVSTTPDRVTNWKLNETKTRRVLHQLTMPGAPSLTDSEPTRHVRLPIKLGASPRSLDITFKNFNERSGTNFGDLDFEDVYVAPMAVGTFGQATPNFAAAPTNLGKPIPTGSGNSRRYQLIRPDWVPEKNTEYILSYAYTDPTPSANQLSISGSFNGTNPGGVGAMTVTNTWSQYTPLEVYLSMDVSVDVPTEAFFDSSSGTGLNSNWPLRDSWAWGVAESNGSLPVMICMSGQTTKAFAAGGFVWTKLQVFAPVDKAHIASGSNDSQSYPLEEMKTDFIALANRIREQNVSQTIVGHNFFPRAAESSTVKARRLGYDAWLFGELPGGILAAYDRAKYLIGADGLMRPELNSGDGTHVNNWGQRLMRAAVITGEQPEDSYRVEELAGRTVHVWDYINGREQLIYGDTGWRSLTVPAVAPLDGSGSILIRRVGSRVTLQFDSVGYTGAGGPEYMTASGFLPAGFCPGYSDNPHGLIANIYTNRFFFVGVLQGSRLRFSHFLVAAPGTGTNALRGQISWTTTQTWPTTLPGSASGTIPNS